jgi:hypothetical protein
MAGLAPAFRLAERPHAAFGLNEATAAPATIRPQASASEGVAGAKPARTRISVDSAGAA